MLAIVTQAGWHVIGRSLDGHRVYNKHALAKTREGDRNKIMYNVHVLYQ